MYAQSRHELEKINLENDDIRRNIKKKEEERDALLARKRLRLCQITQQSKNY